MGGMDEALQSILADANRLLSERKYDEIIALVQPIMIRDTGGQAQRLFGMALLGQGKYQEAVHSLQSTAQMLPNDVTVAFAYGTALDKNGQTEGARAAFERALGIDENHPGARMGYLNTSKALADRDQVTAPMKGIEWLYGAWQRDTNNGELANRILDIYIANGWADSARQFGDLLPAQLKHADPIRTKLKDLPAEAPPAPPNLQVPAPSMSRPVMESCPFCMQQIMAGVHTCPHCKMVIRAKSMPGADYKPEWQEVTLNILCWVGMLLAATQFTLIFVAGGQATPLGALALVISFVQFFANLAIWQRVDFVMHIAKWLYVLLTTRSILCSCREGMVMGELVGREREALMIEVIILLVMGLYSGFMVYLLNHEGE